MAVLQWFPVHSTHFQDNVGRSKFTTKLLSCLIRANSQPILSTHQIHSGLPGGSPCPRLHRVGCSRAVGPIMDCAMLTNHAAMRLRQGGAEEAPGDGRHCNNATDCRTCNATQRNLNVREARPDKLLVYRAIAPETSLALFEWIVRHANLGVSPVQVVPSAVIAAMIRVLSPKSFQLSRSCVHCRG
jgi:hypothetical protein